MEQLMNILNQLCMAVVGAGKAGLDAYGGLVSGIAGLFGPVGEIVDRICMAFVGGGKAGLDAYGGLVEGITGALGQLGNWGKGAAVGGAIAVGGFVAAGNVAQQPAGPLLGQPAATAAAASPSAEVPVTSVASALPGAAL